MAVKTAAEGQGKAVKTAAEGRGKPVEGVSRRSRKGSVAQR